MATDRALYLETSQFKPITNTIHRGGETDVELRKERGFTEGSGRRCHLIPPYLNTDHSLSLFHWCWQKARDCWVSVITGQYPSFLHVLPWHPTESGCERQVPLTQRAESQLRNHWVQGRLQRESSPSENFPAANTTLRMAWGKNVSSLTFLVHPVFGLVAAITNDHKLVV